MTAPAAAGDAVPSFSSLAERRQEISTMYDGYKAGFPEVTPDGNAPSPATMMHRAEG